MVTAATKVVTPAASANPLASFLSGVLGGIKTKLEDTALALTSGVASAAKTEAVATEAVGSASNALAAAEDIGKLVIAVEAHDFANAGKDLLDFVNQAITILGNFKIVLPGLTTAQSLLVKFLG